MKMVLYKKAGVFYPGDDDTQAAMARIPDGKWLSAETKRQRNPQHHRLYWSLVSKVFDNLPEGSPYKTKDQLHTALKFAVGHTEILPMPNGAPKVIPKATDFEKMDQTEFDAYYDAVSDVIGKHFLPGVTDADLKAEVAEMIGATPDMRHYPKAG